MWIKYSTIIGNKKGIAVLLAKKIIFYYELGNTISIIQQYNVMLAYETHFFQTSPTFYTVNEIKYNTYLLLYYNTIHFVF